MERTGHRSTAVRAYKRQSEQQQIDVSRALEPPMKYPKTEKSVEENARVVDAGENASVRFPAGERRMIHLENCSVCMSFQ
jgi:hypothetical protein